MYEIERKEDKVVIRRGGHAVYSAPLESYILYRENNNRVVVAKVKDLTDDLLLLALASAVEIKEENSKG
jgi:hypothetical protein